MGNDPPSGGSATWESPPRFSGATSPPSRLQPKPAKTPTPPLPGPLLEGDQPPDQQGGHRAARPLLAGGLDQQVGEAPLGGAGDEDRALRAGHGAGVLDDLLGGQFADGRDRAALDGLADER